MKQQSYEELTALCKDLLTALGMHSLDMAVMTERHKKVVEKHMETIKKHKLVEENE